MSKLDPWVAKACPSSSAVVRGVPGVFGGYALRETGGSSAVVVRLYDNATTNSGTLVATINVPAGGSVSSEMNWGVRCLAGIYAAVSGSGTVEGSIFTN